MSNTVSAGSVGGKINKSWWTHVGKTLKYALYVIGHPLDGFWDLTHEGRGSIAAANIIVAAMVLVEILRLTLTNFQFIEINMEYFNVVTVALRVLLPLGLWTVANWSLTTLMDGKGKLGEIYMATAYALTPYVIINAAMIIVSQFITRQEGAVYYVLISFSALWSVVLILAAMMEIHDYSTSKAVGSSLLTILGMGIMVFIFVVFFSLISDGIAYFVSLFKEIIFRLT
ncbi:hypothetical protein FACS189450_07080 [Spirochaetia bacterium]|nr:hypothetical protein FACS189450_07080 [Spirochaetia bacterium]